MKKIHRFFFLIRLRLFTMIFFHQSIISLSLSSDANQFENRNQFGDSIKIFQWNRNMKMTSDKNDDHRGGGGGGGQSDCW